MAVPPSIAPPYLSSPLFLENAMAIARQMTTYTVDEIMDFLHINRRIAAQTVQRYRDFPSRENHAAAITAYTGIAYRHLAASTFTEADFLFAQEHLWITSFLYGIHRPLDKIKAYRLEGNVYLPDHDGKTLFQYWHPLLTDLLIERTLEDDGILINLASAEMKRLFDWKRIEHSIRVITPDFQVERSGEYKTVVVYAKMLRGAMARHILIHRIQSPEELKAFSYEGFLYLPDGIGKSQWRWCLRE